MKWLFPFGVIGSVVAALFCGTMLTPLLVTVLAAAGLGALATNPDLVVIPALVAFLLMAYLGWRARRSRSRGTSAHR